MRVTKIRIVLIAAATASIASAVPAAAQQRMDGANLYVDIGDYVGKEVLLIDGVVFGADNSGALVRSGGATFKLSTEGMDRETLRHLLQNCSQLVTPEACQVSLLVTPTSRKTANLPILRSVKLAR